MNCWGAFAVVQLGEFVEVSAADDANCALDNDGVRLAGETTSGGKFTLPSMYMTKWL